MVALNARHVGAPIAVVDSIYEALACISSTYVLSFHLIK